MAEMVCSQPEVQGNRLTVKFFSPSHVCPEEWCTQYISLDLNSSNFDIPVGSCSQSKRYGPTCWTPCFLCGLAHRYELKRQFSDRFSNVDTAKCHHWTLKNGKSSIESFVEGIFLLDDRDKMTYSTEL